MRRAEAEALIGSKVRVWTAANGEYVGTLVEVFGSPWRGRVTITGILKPAQHFERSATVRRGFRVGEVIEGGNTSIRPTPAVGHPDYLAALAEELAWYEKTLNGNPGEKDLWWLHGGIKALKAIQRAEARRLATGDWRVEHSNE